MNIGQAFLKELIVEEIIDCCAQFVGRQVDDHLTAIITEAVKVRLSNAFGFELDRLAVGLAPDHRRPSELDVMPMNLYTYLAMMGIRSNLPIDACQFIDADGIYYYNASGGGFKKG